MPWRTGFTERRKPTGKLDIRFDGDTGSATAAYAEESVKEIDDYLTKRKAYVGTDGQFLSSTAVATVELTLRNLTGDYPES